MLNIINKVKNPDVLKKIVLNLYGRQIIIMKLKKKIRMLNILKKFRINNEK